MQICGSFICIVELIQMWWNSGLVLDEITKPLLNNENILIGIQSLSFGEMPVQSQEVNLKSTPC